MQARDYACFFFQAGDGIRDPLVTGVQTCALPISRDGMLVVSRLRQRGRATARNRPISKIAAARSEERRVGKECTARTGRTREKENRLSGHASKGWRGRDKGEGIQNAVTTQRALQC